MRVLRTHAFPRMLWIDRPCVRIFQRDVSVVCRDCCVCIRFVFVCAHARLLKCLSSAIVKRFTPTDATNTHTHTHTHAERTLGLTQFVKRQFRSQCTIVCVRVYVWKCHIVFRKRCSSGRTVAYTIVFMFICIQFEYRYIAQRSYYESHTCTGTQEHTRTIAQRNLTHSHPYVVPSVNVCVWRRSVCVFVVLAQFWWVFKWLLKMMMRARLRSHTHSQRAGHVRMCVWRAESFCLVYLICSWDDFIAHALDAERVRHHLLRTLHSKDFTNERGIEKWSVIYSCVFIMPDLINIRRTPPSSTCLHWNLQCSSHNVWPTLRADNSSASRSDAIQRFVLLLTNGRVIH